MRIKLTLLVLSLSILACGQIVKPTVTVSPLPIVSDTGTPQTAIRTRTVSTRTSKPDTAAVQATISQAVVTVRRTPGGEASGTYVYSGDRVEIVKCDGDWCRIRKPAGWVFRGCIQELADGLLCMARP